MAVPTVTVKDVVPSLEPYSAPAFYLTTPLGDSDNNVIYINRRNSPQGLELYTTLAHEGFPGHLYQTVYSNRIFSDMHTDPARKQLHDWRSAACCSGDTHRECRIVKADRLGTVYFWCLGGFL